MPSNSRAWVTYVTDEEKVVTKALVLADSLKRVRSAITKVVFASHSLDGRLKEQLLQAFDLIIPTISSASSLHFQLEEEALIHALTLKSFEKCVFLSPECLVLRNCDDLFEKFECFGMSKRFAKDGAKVVGFTPSLAHSKSLRSFMVAAQNGNKNHLHTWIQNKIKNISYFGMKYDVLLDLKRGAIPCLERDAAIVTFADKHPLDNHDDDDDSTKNGSLELYAERVFRKIYEELEQNSVLELELEPRQGSGELIAVVGMSCRLPGANDIDEFWNILSKGINTVRPVPPSRWGRNHSFLQSKDKTQSAGFLSIPVDEFDYKFFGISPREAELLDPQQRLLHEVTWEALEDATMNPSDLKGTNTSFFVGTWIYDYREITFRVPDFDFFRTYMGNSVAVSAARLSHFYETIGPSIGVESACSSSISAIHMACKTLQNRETNLALACGANLIIHPFEPMKQNIALSPTGQCRTFDEKADGFARAEGCCAIVLKRLSDAVRDGDDIWALIRGSAVVQEGMSKSMGTPTIQCEAKAMELALKDAGVDPEDVSFLEAHGTGTPVGDPMEIAAISKAYGGGRKTPLYIGSVKTNIGHTEAASGLAGLIKVILSMKNELIPAHLNFDKLNPEIKLDDIPARIPVSSVPWLRNSRGPPRLAGVSSFGISGTDGHLIVQEPPVVNGEDSIKWKVERPLSVLKLSAKCEESLEILIKKYEAILDLDSNAEFCDIAHTANIGRANFPHRASIIAGDSHEALSVIREKCYKTNRSTAGAVGGTKLCFLFTGQGSQYPKMAKVLYDSSPVFQSHFQHCCSILKGFCETIDLSQLVFGSASNSKMINQTLNSQISIFVVEYCLLKLWETWGVTPDYVLGHSLGEFAAAVAAGVLDLESALRLVAARSILIDSLPQGSMLVVKASEKTVNSLLLDYKSNSNFWLDVAAINSQEQTVLAGDSENVQEFSNFCESKGIKTVTLASAHAFHSRHMELILEKYTSVCSTVLENINYKRNCQYISGVEGKIIEEETLLDTNYWVKHCREKVNYLEACKTAQNEGCTLFLEIGPHPILSALTLLNMEGSQGSVTCLPSIRKNEGNWETMLQSLSSLWLSNWHGKIDWVGFDKHYNRKKVSVPFYPFIGRPIWAEMEPHMEWSLTPLLGRKLPNPSSITLFDNYITPKQFSYLPDHSIGNKILFPGAGFLEICLGAGHATAQGFTDIFSKPHRAVGLKNLEIVAPLAISEVRACNIQTVVKLEEEKEGEHEITSYGIQVYHWLEEKEGEEQLNKGGKWILHANASFLPFISSNDGNVEKLDLERFRIASTNKEWNSTEIYENIAKLGLRLGSNFQRIHKGWWLEDSEVLFEVKLPEAREEYMLHPVIGDAMIQAIMIWSNKSSATNGKWKKRLQIPVKVGEFVRYPNENQGSDAFIYCYSKENGGTTAMLVTQSGETLAQMSSVEFIETSSKFVEGLIQQQSVLMPKLWEEVWRPCQGVLESSIPSKILEEIPRVVQPEIRCCMEDRNSGADEGLLPFYTSLCQFTLFQFLKALNRLGWQPKSGDRFTISELISSLSIKNKFTNYVCFFLNKLANEKYLSKTDEESWTVEVGERQLSEAFDNFIITDAETRGVSSKESKRCDYRHVSEIGNKLAEILSGKLDPLTLVFPEDPNKPNAEGIYTMVASQIEPAARYANSTLTSSFPVIKTDSTSNTLRCLEIGSGTGVSTSIFFECIHSSLEKTELTLEYFYTDISPSFFAAAKANPKLQNYLKYITFKKLDIECDPFSQGFSPEYFDVILAAEVIHATKNVQETIKHLASLIKPSGFIQIYETVSQCPIVMFIFGLLDGYWRFKDYDLRKNSPVIRESQWKQILEENGFTNVSTASNYNGVHAGIFAYRQQTQLPPVLDADCSKAWLIFGDEFTRNFISDLKNMMGTIGRKLVVLDRPKLQSESREESEKLVKELFGGKMRSLSKQLKIEGILYLWGILEDEQHDQSNISFPFLSLCQEVLKTVDSGLGASAPKLFVLTNGLNTSMGSVMLNPSASTLLGISKSVPIEHNNLTVNVMDLPINFEDCASQVFYNLWTTSDKNDFYSFRNNKRFVRRMKSKKIMSSQLRLPNSCDRFQLAIPSTKQISDLEFTHLEKCPLEKDQVEVHIKAMALNFRDVFSILKPIPIFDQINTVGLDFAGVVTSVGSDVVDFKPGDKVIGFNSHKNLALPSHLTVAQNLIVHLPQGMTYCEGATLPAVFMTSIYCLFNLARVQQGETVLIHTASGGVGLSAIQLAKQANVNIIATAGSERKRAYLRNLGIPYVFNSRNTEFADEILKVTKGKGVEIVLNSLTGPGFKEASLKALGRNGRFVEMSKLGVWSKEEVAELRGDVEYHMIDIKALSDEFIEDIMKSVRSRLNGESKDDAIMSLPFERFDALDIRSALYYLQQAKHIGKVVCVMPEIRRENAKLNIVTPLFNERSTYIVTGGLGGIAFEVVKWMLRNGAKYLAIVSRSSFLKPEISEKIRNFNEKEGKYVQTFSVDVSSHVQCSELFEKIQKRDSEFPAIRGVMHAAGILDDATLENQSWAKFQSTYNSKVDGSWNLHLLTKNLNLEHFVMFSSISSVLGAPGQANYSASNNFEDALAHFRHSQGLPAISINWGHWAEVGMATEADFPGVRSISTSEGLLFLGTVLRSPGTTQVVACNIESFSLLSHMFPNLKQYADDPSLFENEQKAQLLNSITSDEFWSEVDAAQDRAKKIEVFKTHIKIFVRNILKMEASEPIGDQTDFQSLGVDSLMMLEMKNSIQNLLGSRLTVTASHIRDCSNVSLLANRFMDLIESKEEEDEMPTLEELRQLIHEDCQLLSRDLGPPKIGPVNEKDIQTVLVTGCTGALGPYVLQDLLKLQNISKIYCLVRKKGNLSAAERLETIMNKRGVAKQMAKFEVVEGDVSKENLGLSEQLYAQLSSEVDAVIHLAAKSDHIAKYWKAPPTRLTNIRNVNVLGTKRVLEFAANLRVKHVFHASSLLVITTTKEEDGTLTEDWQMDEAYDCLSYNSGYMISKFVSEQLVKQAMERWNIPCTSLRFALVSGDGKTGELDILSNHYMLRLLAFLKMRCMPDQPIPYLLIPPDACSKALIRICFNEKARPGVYNVAPPHPQLEQVFVKVAAGFGIHVELVALEEFLQRLNSEGGNDSNDNLISSLKRIYTKNESRYLEIASGVSSISQWLGNSSQDYFVSRKLEELLPGFLEGIEPTDEIMMRDLQFAKRTGAFETVGIRTEAREK